jgi:hypothetical protein
VHQVITADAGVGIEIAPGLVFAPERAKQLREQGVLEDVGELPA